MPPGVGYRYRVTTDQGTFMVTLDQQPSSDAELQALVQQHLTGGAPPEERTPPPPVPAPAEAEPTGLEAIFGRSPTLDMTGGVNPLANLKTAAWRSRFGPSLIPNPLLSGAASAAGEYAAQEFEGQPETDWGQVAAAGAIPPAAAGLGRLGRALGRTRTRMSPSAFGRAHEEAAEGLAGTAQRLRPEVGSAALAPAARAALQQGDVIAAPRLAETITNLEMDVGSAPVSGSMKAVRQHLDNIRQALGEGGAIPLAELNRLRLDLGRSLKAAPEVRALYGAIVQDLDAAAGQAGGEGAGLIRQMAEAYKRELGAQRLEDLGQAVGRPSGLAGGTVALDIAKLKQRVLADKELPRLIGDEGMAQVMAFLDKYRTLPPTHVATAWSSLLGSLGAIGVGGGAGLALGGIPGAVAGAIIPELGRNAFGVGRNPRTLNILGALSGQGARVGLQELQRQGQRVQIPGLQDALRR